MNAHVWVKRALLLIIIGLIVQLFCLIHVTPGSFMVFALAGVGPMLLGFAAFVYAMALARARTTGDGHDER